MNCSSFAYWNSPQGVDECSGSTLISASHNSGDLSPQGTTDVEYVFEDGNGNQSICSFKVIVNTSLASTGQTTDELAGNDGSIVLNVTGGLQPYSFDWDNDGTGDFDDEKNQNNLSGGNYAVVIKDANQCLLNADFSVESQLGLDDLERMSFSVYPNPSNGNMYIEVIGLNGQSWTVVVQNTIGQTIHVYDFYQETEHIDLRNEANGVYMLSIQSEGHSEMIRVVKQ